jgi:membrane protein YqaA with SNARE-associated domain
MQIYLLLFVLFIIQEPVSSDAILLEAYQNHYNVWIIHALFVVATLLDIAVGYWIGKWLQERYAESSHMRRFMEWARKASTFAGKYGEYLFLFIWGPYVFPLSTLIAPWIEIPFWKTFVFLFLGDLVFWYGSEWLIVLGVKSAIPNPLQALYGVVIVSLLIALALRYFRRR